MKKMKKIFLIFIFFFLSISSTYAYDCPWYYRAWPILALDSSPFNGQLWWSGTTKYLNEWKYGVYTWNNMGKIPIIKTNHWWSSDLTIEDDYDDHNGVEWLGTWEYNVYLPDEIKFNTYLLDKKNKKEKRNTTIHELGHALGLKHSYKNNIMYDTVTKQTSLGWQDKQCYNYNWD